MNKLSFGIISSNDFLQKLIDEVEEYEKQLASSRHAINAAMTAWHLIDWVYHDFNLQPKYGELFKFQAAIKVKYPKIQIMHDIANGMKHCKLNRHTPVIEESILKEGDYSDDYCCDYNISRLQVIFHGDTLDFILELENVRDFWINYFWFGPLLLGLI